jgi:hypothetical protein
MPLGSSGNHVSASSLPGETEILVLLHPGQTETICVFLAFRNELEETLSGVCDHEVEFFLKAN